MEQQARALAACATAHLGDFASHHLLALQAILFPQTANSNRSSVTVASPNLPGFLMGLVRLGQDVGRRIEQGRDVVAQNARRVALPPHMRWPCFASLSVNGERGEVSEGKCVFDVALSQDLISQTLQGVSVYTVSNSGNEFVLVSDPSGQKSMSVLCFRKEDAESLLSQVKVREPALGRGAKVVAVSLDKVYKLSAEGIAFRFLPDPSQVKNAIEARTKSGATGKVFDGIPIFQSENLILRSGTRRFVPIFFCKEDLERALRRAFKQQQRTRSSLRVGTDFQVGSLEDVLKKMESHDESSGWGDFVFIPPGKDHLQHLGRAFG
eukprot:c19388_g1_i1 orf=371-1339(-)